MQMPDAALNPSQDMTVTLSLLTDRSQPSLHIVSRVDHLHECDAVFDKAETGDCTVGYLAAEVCGNIGESKSLESLANFRFKK